MLSPDFLDPRFYLGWNCSSFVMLMLNFNSQVELCEKELIDGATSSHRVPFCCDVSKQWAQITRLHFPTKRPKQKAAPPPVLHQSAAFVQPPLSDPPACNMDPIWWAVQRCSLTLELAFPIKQMRLIVILGWRPALLDYCRISGEMARNVLLFIFSFSRPANFQFSRTSSQTCLFWDFQNCFDYCFFSPVLTSVSASHFVFTDFSNFPPSWSQNVLLQFL